MASNESSLDCVIVGYKEYTIAEKILATHSDESGFRCCQRQYINYENKAFYYHDLISYLRTGNLNYDVEKEYRKNYFSVNELPYLALLYLTSYLKKRGMNAEMVNLFDCEKKRLKALLNENPLVVAVSSAAYTNPLPMVKIVQFIRKHNPEVKIVIGGPYIHNKWHSSTLAEYVNILRVIAADYYIVESQGEATLYNFLYRLKRKEDPHSIKNLVWLEQDILNHAGFQPENNMLDQNTINWDFIDSASLGKTINIRTSRGCPHRCSFCTYPVRNKHMDFYSLESVEQSLLAVTKKALIENIIFIDDTFNIPLKRFKDLCRIIIKHNFSFRWFSYFRVKEADEESVQLMRASNCGGVFLGLESADDTVLKNMNKKARLADYYHGIELLIKYDIPTFAFFLLGYPGETKTSVNKTINFIKNSGLTLYTVNLWYADVSTPICQERDKYMLEGKGFSWRHATMDHTTASNYIDEIFSSVKGPIWTPGENFGYWSIPYLMGKGFSFQQIQNFLKNANQLLELNFDPAKKARVNEKKIIAEIEKIVKSI